MLGLGSSLAGDASLQGNQNNLLALEFDGVNDYVELDDANVFTPNSSGADRGFSISIWFKSLEVASGGPLLVRYNWYNSDAYHHEWQVRTDFLERPILIIYGDDDYNIKQTFVIDDILAVGTWYHLVFTWDLSSDNTGIIGYVNGVQKTHGSGGTHSAAGAWAAVANTGGPLLVGGDGSTYRNCKLDEIALFDNELSSSTVTDIYNSGKPKDISGEDYLVAYWRCGDGDTYPTIQDRSSNSNDGTMTNMTASDITTDTP